MEEANITPTGKKSAKRGPFIERPVNLLLISSKAMESIKTADIVFPFLKQPTLRSSVSILFNFVCVAASLSIMDEGPES